MPDTDRALALADGRPVLAIVLAGALMIAVATIAGAWLARRHAARRELCFGAAAGALLVIAGMHLLPDAWSAAARAGVSVWIVPVLAIVSFALAGVAVRKGCSCEADREAAAGGGTAGALAAHRWLEGAALALAGSVAVAVALVVHALAEGLAAGTLLGSVPRRKAAIWLTAMCASPVAGAVMAAAWSFPARLEPAALAIAAGVLAQAARISLAAAFRNVRPATIAISAPAVSTVMAAVVTAAAVHGAG
jgi:ZIP family zinc transporter